MIAVDSSVAVAAFGDWHRFNRAACAVLDKGVTVPAPVILETYSVLTGFPPPHRASPDLVERWLDGRFPTILGPPSPEDHRHLVHQLAAAGRIGGSIYDAVVALTARIAGAVLVTADARATAIYELIGVEVRFLQ